MLIIAENIIYIQFEILNWKVKNNKYNLLTSYQKLHWLDFTGLDLVTRILSWITLNPVIIENSFQCDEINIKNCIWLCCFSVNFII